MSSRMRYAAWLLIPLALFLPWPFLDPIRFFGNTDTVFYVNILALISDALHHGDIFPSWLYQANNGYGSPVMLFYAPLGYLITALLCWPLESLHLSIQTQFLFGIYASQVVSGITAWVWLRCRFESRQAFAGSVLFVLLPYKIMYIYGHCNLAQLWALAFLPVWMLAAEKVAIERGVRWIALYALSAACVYYAHPLTAIAFGWIPVLYVMWFGRGNGIAPYVRLAFALLLAAGLCLMKALPQHEYLPFIHTEGFLEGRLNWKNNIYHIDLTLCAYYGLIAIIGSEIFRHPELKNSAIGRTARFWVVVLGIVFFLATPLSSVLWQHVKLLQYLQFPSARLHAGALMAVTWLLCAWLASYSHLITLYPLIYRKSTIGCIIVLFAGVTLWRIVLEEHKPTDLTWEYIQNVQAAKILPPPEYKTVWLCGNPQAALAEYMQHTDAPPVKLLSGQIRGLYAQWHAGGELSVKADVQSEHATLQVHQCYFPIWALQYASGQAQLQPQPGSGLIEMTLGKGPKTVVIAPQYNPGEKLGRTISVIALVVAGLMLCNRPLNKEPVRPARS